MSLYFPIKISVKCTLNIKLTKQTPYPYMDMTNTKGPSTAPSGTPLPVDFQSKPLSNTVLPSITKPIWDQICQNLKSKRNSARQAGSGEGVDGQRIGPRTFI